MQIGHPRTGDFNAMQYVLKAPQKDKKLGWKK